MWRFCGKSHSLGIPFWDHDPWYVQLCLPNRNSPCQAGKKWGNPLLPAASKYLLVPVCGKWCLPQLSVVRWHPARSFALLESPLASRVGLAALLEICSCRMSSDMTFVLPSPAHASQGRPVFPPVCLALLVPMFPSPSLGWVWLIPFHCSETDNSPRLLKYLSAETNLLCKLHILSTGIALSWVSLRNQKDPMSVLSVVYFSPPCLSHSPEKPCFLSGWRLQA